MASPNTEPWCLRPSELETWYKTNIQNGTASFDDTCRKVVKDVVGCLENSDMPTISEIIKGGSLGKGTMVTKSDIDLVVFISPTDLKPITEIGPEEYKLQVKHVLADFKRTMEREFGGDIKTTPFSVQFSIPESGRLLDVDLLPTAYNVPDDKAGKSALFQTMMLQKWWEREYYSVSFVKSQLQFVKSQQGCVKELIRLVKYWARNNLPNNLRTSYPLELITIFRWRRAGKPRSFSMARGLKGILFMLTSLSGTRTYWRDHYRKEFAREVIRELYPTGPVMLDPVNPTSNVFDVYQGDNSLKEIRVAAHKTLGSTLLKDLVHHRKKWCN